MVTSKLTRKIELFPQEAYNQEGTMEQQILVNSQVKRERAFKVFMEKMYDAEKSVMEHGFLSEDEVEDELSKI